jgi:hypothetical protein
LHLFDGCEEPIAIRELLAEVLEGIVAEEDIRTPEELDLTSSTPSAILVKPSLSATPARSRPSKYGCPSLAVRKSPCPVVWEMDGPLE